MAMFFLQRQFYFWPYFSVWFTTPFLNTFCFLIDISKSGEFSRNWKVMPQWSHQKLPRMCYPMKGGLSHSLQAVHSSLFTKDSYTQKCDGECWSWKRFGKLRVEQVTALEFHNLQGTRRNYYRRLYYYPKLLLEIMLLPETAITRNRYCYCTIVLLFWRILGRPLYYFCPRTKGAAGPSNTDMDEDYFLSFWISSNPKILDIILASLLIFFDTFSSV